MTGKKNRVSKVQETFTKDSPLRAGGLKLFVGAKVEALDSRRWYQAKVVRINESASKVLVHFEGWNSRHDTWFAFDSTSLRPLHLFETSQEQSSKRKELKPGDRVLARWSDSKFYPAKVHSLVNEKVVEVIFFDGFKKRLNKNGIRPDPKKTFENFEEKFAFPPLEGHHITTPVSSVGESRIKEPVSSASSSRTKRRHTEPSTMADFVTSIPGKRPKHYLGIPSDSDDLLSPHDIHEHKTKEDDIENLGTSTGVKRGLALRKQRRLGYPVEEDMPVSSPRVNRSPSDVSVKRSPKNQLSSSAESLVSGIDSDKIGDFEKTDSQSFSKFAKRKIGNILQIKLPMKMQGRRRGRKKRFFRLNRVDLSAKKDPSSVEEKVQLSGAEIEKPATPETNESGKDGNQAIDSYPENNQKSSSDKTSETRAPEPATDGKLSSDKSHICKEGEVSEENKTFLQSNKPVDSEKSVSEKSVLSNSIETVRVPRKRGRKPNKLKAAKTSSMKEPKILPRRERKLTEKGLELLQTISHKKGMDCHLKEAFVGLDVLENVNLKSDLSDPHKHEILEKSGTGMGDGLAKEQNEESCRQKVNIDVEEKPTFSGEKHDISSLDTLIPRSESLGVSKEKKEEAQTADSHMMLEAHDLNKDDDKYSDSCSEGSGGLVIDVADEPKVGSNSGAMADEFQSDSASKSGQEKSVGSSNEKSIDAKTRTFARLKYTLSHEERRGNKVAKLKKNRFRKKLKGRRGRVRKENLKKSKSIDVESQKSQLLDENKLPHGSESSVGVSPLESLTRMVTETSQSIGLSSDAKFTPVSDAGQVDASIEETSKPVKSTKQQRAPYKSRLKVTDSFLSMVEQDRPSQIERPLSDDLIKEKSVRGRPRHRTTNRADSQNFQETIVPKREELQQSDLNEPLEFSSSGSAMETIDLSETNIPRMVYHRQEMASFVGEQSRYGPPPHVGAFPVPSSTMIGQMRLPHPPPQQIELFRDGSPQGSIPAIPIANSEHPGYDRRAKNVTHIAAYQGAVGVSNMRGPVLDFPTQLQPLVGSNRITDSSGQAPEDCTTRCLRLQNLSIVKQEPWESQKRIENCPCQNCHDSKLLSSLGAEKNDTKQGGGNQVVSNIQSENNSSHIYEGCTLPSVTNTEKSKIMDREIVITDVFSLRDSGIMAPQDKKPGQFKVKEQKSVDCKSHGSPGLKDAWETTREVTKETSEPVYSSTKPKGFETKKKRLDFITGKLSAQKRMSPNIDDAFKKSDKSGSNSSSPALLKDSSVAATEDSARTSSPYNSQTTVGSDPQLKQQQLGYMYPQTTFIPVINPYFEPQPGIPPSSMDVPPQRVVSPESHMVPHHPLYMDPRPYYRNPEYFQPIPSVFDAEGVPPPGYQHPPPGIAYMPPDMVGQMRFHQLPGFPYGSSRFAPAPRYFIPREPIGTARPPPPYGTFSMVSASQRFRAIAPSGRIPLVVCKQANCNCHLPHSAPPIQVVPPSTQSSQAPEKAAEDDIAFSKAQQMTKVSEPMMKVDPRRLTLPLQRMKKMGLKPQKDSKDSLILEGKQERPHSDDVGKEGADSNGSMDEHGDIEAASRQSLSENNQPKARNEDGKVSKQETHVQRKTGTSRRYEKGSKKETVLAPREFVVELDLNEFQCKYRGCKKSFRKASSRDNHQRYFHSPRAPQKRQKPPPSLPSPASCDSLLSPAPAQAKTDPKASNEDLTSIRSGYSSSVVTDENVSDREKQEESSSDESDDSFLDSNGSVCIDDVIRCKCGDLEEQGFMIQCEQCFTWQHGDCVNLTVQTVPKNYLCYICLNPKGLRPSFKYKNNYDWYKRGTLPSLVEIQDENQEKIAELMQASHALMEDISNVFDVIAGMKRKIALLNEKSHPALKFWEPVAEPRDKESTDSKADGEFIDTGNIPDKFGAVSDCQDQNIVEKNESERKEQKSDTAEETNLAVSSNCGNMQGKDKTDRQTENTPKEKNSNNTDFSHKLRTSNNGAGESVPAKEAEDTETGIANKTSTDPNFSAAVTQNRIDSEKLETIESEPLDIVRAKLNLQDHLDDIEGKLNERMDEIEKNLDVLERKYVECEKKANEGESKSAFKITLPDMTSVVRHLNLINRQLMNLS